MDREPLNPPSIDQMDYTGNSELTPIVDMEAQLRALLTLGGSGEGSEAIHPPDNYFSAGHEQSRQQEHRYKPFRPTSTPPLQARRVSSLAQIQSWDEQFKMILTERLNILFDQYAHTARTAKELPLQDWLRAAIWWAVQGKAAVEDQQPTETDQDQDQQQRADKEAVQGLVNLAKAWWICHHIVAQDTFKIRMAACRLKGTPDSALFDQYRAVLSYLRSYERQMEAVLCTDNNMSSTVDVDKRLWISYPALGLYNAILDNSQRQAWEYPCMAFGDPGDLFCYSSAVVEATLIHPDDPSLPASTFECIFSIMRGSESWQTIGVLASQVQLIHITIQSERAHGLVWKDIEWDVARHSMVLILHHSEAFLRVKLSEDSFASIWRLAHDIVAAEADLVAGEDENLLFDETVKSCQYVNHDKPVGFPAKPVAHCRVHLLKKLSTVTHGTVKRKVHGGLRIIVATPPHTRAQRRVTHDLPNTCPLAYSLLDEEDRSPGLLLHLDEACSLFIYLEDPEARTLLHSLLLDCVPLRGETDPKSFLISSYAIDMQGHGSERQTTKHPDSGESQASVIEEESDRESRGTHYGKTILSEHLRVIIQNEWCSITDRLNIVALPIHDNAMIHLHRLPQEDLSMTVAHDLVSKDHLAKIRSLLQSIQTKPSIRIVKFKTQADLHSSQEAVTGFRILYDGFQIIAFFHQFRHWKCLNFEVTALDETEKMEQKGESGVRIKDAKYALPLNESGSGAGELPSSLCLDELEFPTEHSDVAIMFGDVIDIRTLGVKV
ncbi:hypothetical protein BJX65DRAFT_294034 [Aspergillus insuetus]